MDQANHPILPGTSQGVSVSPGEQEEEKNQELYLPGVGESSEPDHPGRNRDLVGRRAAADGTGGAASVPRALLGFDDTERPPPPHQRGGGGDDDDDDGDDRGGECPICNERFGASGERRLALLHCDHALCRHCLWRILKRARDPSRVQCPFCRQNTPVSRRDLVRMMMLEEARDDDGGGGGGGGRAAAPEAPYAHASSYSSAPLLAGVQPADPHGTPQVPLGCLFAPGSEQVQQQQQQQQQLGVWGSGGGGGGGGAGGGGGGGGDACASWICPASAAEWLGVVRRPACCLPSTTVLLVMLLMLPWFFMSLRYL